jgi:hypothetical protein
MQADGVDRLAAFCRRGSVPSGNDIQVRSPRFDHGHSSGHDGTSLLFHNKGFGRRELLDRRLDREAGQIRLASRICCSETGETHISLGLALADVATCEKLAPLAVVRELLRVDQGLTGADRVQDRVRSGVEEVGLRLAEALGKFSEGRGAGMIGKYRSNTTIVLQRRASTIQRRRAELDLLHIHRHRWQVPVVAFRTRAALQELLY